MESLKNNFSQKCLSEGSILAEMLAARSNLAKQFVRGLRKRYVLRNNWKISGRTLDRKRFQQSKFQIGTFYENLVFKQIYDLETL
jgi:hypothetical protein